MIKYRCLFLLLFSYVQLFSQQLDSSVHTVLFLGNSITYAGGYITAIETAFTLAHPNQSIQFINLGLPSETVSGLSEDGHAGGRFPRPDLHERLHRILGKVHADIVFACYGMNDGIYLPFNEQRFAKYREGMRWLHDTLAATGAKVIIITPPVFDELRGGHLGYAAVLDTYADWLLQQSKTTKWSVADIHYPMKKYLDAHRQQDSAAGVDGFSLAADGIHPGEAGHWLIAKQLLRFLGERSLASYASLASLTQQYKNGAAIASLVAAKQSMMKDAWLSATGHTRPEMNTGLPLQEALEKAKGLQEQITTLLHPVSALK
ncbi:MAG TPA: SGNH/GDSL hydrolase family protein [Chitinophagaceae bacterium]|nr:SGNH/GDSL hydrolase family protein [Chitinophagaceae bacterium]